MKKILSLILSVILGINCLALLAAAGPGVFADNESSSVPEVVDLKTRKDFEFGINTHSKNYPDYPESYLEEQIHAVARLGSKWIRFGGSIPDDGDWSYLDTAVGLCNKYGLKIIMVIEPSTSFGLEYITLVCETFAYRYNGQGGRGFVDCFQVWNEIDLFLMKEKYGGSAPDGISENHYFTISVDGVGDLPEYLQYFKAAEKGIRAGKGKSKFMVNFSTTHCGMITYFLRKGLKIDMVGWDLYSTKPDREESAQKIKETLDTVEERIYNKYKVPLIICETNVDMRTLSLNEKKECDLSYYQRLLDIIYLAYRRSWLKGAIFYELVDEISKFGTNSVAEGWYGLIRNDAGGGAGVLDTSNEKPIYKELQRLIGGNEQLPVIKQSKVNLKPYEKLVVDTADDSGEGDAAIDEKGNNSSAADTGTKTDDKTDKDSNTNTDNESDDFGNIDTDLEDNSVDDPETDIGTDDFDFSESLDDLDDSEISGAIGEQIKEIRTKETVYDMPWLIIGLASGGLLLFGAAAVVIYVLIYKKKAKKLS